MMIYGKGIPRKELQGSTSMACMEMCKEEQAVGSGWWGGAGDRSRDREVEPAQQGLPGGTNTVIQKLFAKGCLQYTLRHKLLTSPSVFSVKLAC